MVRKFVEDVSMYSLLGGVAGTVYGLGECIKYNTIYRDAAEWSDRIGILASNGGAGMLIGVVGSVVVLGGARLIKKRLDQSIDSL